MGNEIEISIITSLITAYASYLLFKSKRWLELKIEKYSEVMGLLHRIKKADTFFSEAYYEDQSLPQSDEDAKEWMAKREKMAIYNASEKCKNEIISLKESQKIAFEEISKTIDTSLFILGDDIVTILIDLQDNYQHQVDWDRLDDQIGENRKLVDTCLKSLKSRGKYEFANLPESFIYRITGLFF